MQKTTIQEMNRLTPEAFHEAKKVPLIVVLDHVRSQHNIGAVFRTADAFCLQGVWLCGICCCPPNNEIHKTALGAELTVDWQYFEQTLDAVKALQKDGYTVLEAADGVEAMELFYADKQISLVILDVMMPRMDGWKVCKEIRKNSKVPIMMLSALTEERDELKGFELGVDEYVAKPFRPNVLVARVGALLKRAKNSVEEAALNAGGIILDKAAHTVTVDGNHVELSVKEFELLTYFVENPHVALSREKILNNVWNYDYYGDARTIDTHVKKLRSKLGDKGDYIQTIWGKGYKFEVTE